MYKVCETVRATHGQDGAVVLDIRQGRMFNLNLAASRIVELLKIGLSESEIADQMSQEFGIRRDAALRDLRECLENLKKHHLVEECGPQAGT